MVSKSPSDTALLLLLVFKSGKSTSDSEEVEGVLFLLRFLPLGFGMYTSESDEE